jgi:membrane protein involved in colicin uptake
MARTKGSKNRATVIAEELIAGGMTAAKAKTKAKMQAMREKKSALKATPTKKKTSKKKVASKKAQKAELHEIILGYNTTTQNAFLKAKNTNSRKNAIRSMCLLCVGGSVKEIKECSAEKTCPLWKFRITG